MNEQQKQDRIAELVRKVTKWWTAGDDDTHQMALVITELDRLTAPPAEKTEGEKIAEELVFERAFAGSEIGIGDGNGGEWWALCRRSEPSITVSEYVKNIRRIIAARIDAAIAAEVEAAIAQAREERNQREADLEHERNSRRHAEAELAKFDRHNKELRAEVKRQQAEIERLEGIVNARAESLGIIHDVASERLRQGDEGDWYTVEAYSRIAAETAAKAKEETR